MVDIRPLLFINALMLMLLVTAGFVQVNNSSINPAIPDPSADLAANEDDGSVVQDEISTKDESKSDTENTSAVTKEPSATKTKDAEFIASSTTDQVKESSNPVKAPPTKPALVSQDQMEEAIFADEAIFAGNVQSPINNEEARRTLSEYTKGNDEPMVVSYSSKPKTAPKPAKNIITTGKLVVRSNVYEDVVLVNGKPYGPTKLELELTPGSYIVEVAKEGYNSWNTQVDVRRGQTNTLNARLEKYTSVSYAKGVWQHDIKTGEGTYIEEGKLEYNGSFVNGKFHGIGSVRYANGMKYQGEWFEGTMKGHGTLTTPEGDTYIGEMDDGKFNGEGTLTKATGDIFAGFWIDGELNGQGSLTTQNGLLYVGGFSDNLFHGNGSLTYPDGGHYEGSFSNGLYHGKGNETLPDGKKYVGQFIDGLYHGKGELMNPNGSKITGTFKDGKPFGKATLTTAEGEVFTARSSEPGVCYRQKSYRATACPELEGW